MYLFNTLELQVRMKFGMVGEVSTFLVITPVSNRLKNSHILIFSKYKYLHVKIASLANVNPVSPLVQFINVWPCMYNLGGLYTSQA